MPRAQRIRSPFEPSTAQLLAGETVITSNAQMKDVWAKLFSALYDPAQFDFQHEFVPPPGGFQVSVVRVSKDLLDDVVFHRRQILGL